MSRIQTLPPEAEITEKALFMHVKEHSSLDTNSVCLQPSGTVPVMAYSE